MVDVVQLVRASDCGSECRGFESHLPPPFQEVPFFKELLFYSPPKNHGNMELSQFSGLSRDDASLSYKHLGLL